MPFGNLKLNDGNEIPAIAFGTGSKWYEKDAQTFVEQALENGFSHIDTAQIYKNEDSVGDAIREAGLKREDLYITTKYGGGVIRESFETSLKKLGLKQVDLYLIHTPAFVEGKLEASWREFEKIKDDGLSKSIGVSNFSVGQLRDLLKIARIKPAANQIRLHPYNWAEQKELVEFSTAQGIVTEAYSSLTPITKTPGGPVDPVLDTIALRIGASPAQVIFKWLAQKNVLIVTTSSKKERLDEYLAVADLHEFRKLLVVDAYLSCRRTANLTDAEIAAIEEAGAKGAPAKKYVRYAKFAAYSVLGVALYFVPKLIFT